MPKLKTMETLSKTLDLSVYRTNSRARCLLVERMAARASPWISLSKANSRAFKQRKKKSRGAYFAASDPLPEAGGSQP
ncbi:hypothetical protein E1A91_D10G130700v1 [Gossypium mustelinum]|uniref:Uncharacterized protein n=1 Tax=Gossypium mustelinum TaxID=34275 RepID=A0A5D2T9K1_GOSMU|nr:hypothetical protein E1A91_D10G130700v1 [Gossypium mustelinum]